MIYTMHLDEIYFKLIIEKKKKVEIRLNDPKRKLLNLGDTIKFINRANTSQSINVKIDDLSIYNSFEAALLNTKPTSLGWDNLYSKEMLKKIYKIYTSEEEKIWGIIKINFHII